MMAPGRKIAVTEHIEVEWLQHGKVPALCPNCGAQGEAEQILDIDYRPPVEHDDEHRFIMQICPNCSVRFVDNMKMMEFHSEQQVERGEDALHVQIGAGLWPIAGQIARLDRPRGARVLEIGGAYGFGLDFALRARGWTGEGYDPSPFAAVGMRELDLPLRQEYFTVRHLERGPWDVAIATELLEHVSYPAAFLLLMRRALGETGVLLLSTPNAERITPDLPASSLLPLLSPGSHTVLQTPRSLELALRAAGFAHSRIIADGLSLIAYASAAPFTLNDDEAARRAMYRTYLVERAGLAALTSDLRLGFAGRGIFEAVNDADWDAADAAWAALLPAVRERFGLDLETMAALPAGAETASLAKLGRLMPLGLGMILFARAMRLLVAGRSRQQVEPHLHLAAGAIAALLRALAAHSLQDALSADIARLLHVELLICAAADGRAAAVEGLAALGDETTSWRGFVELVNRGDIALATALKAHLPDQPSPAIPAGLRRDALLCLGNFRIARTNALITQANIQLGPEGDVLAALAIAETLLAMGAEIDELCIIIFARLVNAGHYEQARRLLPAVEPLLRALQPPFAPAPRDALFSAGILFMQRQEDLRRAATSFARLRDGLVRTMEPGAAPEPLFWPALRGEVIVLHQLARAEDATALLRGFIGAYPGAPDDLREQLTILDTGNKTK
jgi:2-polyprenyl-3-methyl-5-hydroxy-6-metoxy-1,4-benzoquinol methylase